MTEAVVLDAGVALRWFMTDPLRSNALALLDVRDTLAAPDTLPADVAALACEQAGRGAITPAHAEAIAAAAPHYVPRLEPAAGLVGRAVDMALAFHLPHESALYLACAERLGGMFVTADRALLRAVSGSATADWVMHLDAIEVEGGGTAATESPLRVAPELLDEVVRRTARLRGCAADSDLHALNVRGLRVLLQGLERDELVDVLALAWLGQGRGQAAWEPLRARAEAFIGTGKPPVPFVCRLAPHVHAGLERLKRR